MTYSVVASGTDPLRYQWRFNGDNIPDGTNAILTLLNVQPAHSGEYQVLILNSAGSVLSEPASLFVTTPPQITGHPQDQNVRTNMTASFSVGRSTKCTPMAERL